MAICLLTLLAVAGSRPCGLAASSDPPGQAGPEDAQKAQLAEGWRQVYLTNWPKAATLFEAVLEESGDREVRAEALYGLANLWQTRQPGPNLDKALHDYKRVTAEFADTRAAPWAHLALARLADQPEHEKERDLALARETYERILRDYPDHYVADEAALRLGFSYLEAVGVRESEDQGVAIFEKRLASRPRNTLAIPMRMLLGNLYERRGEYRKAVDQWMAADAIGIPLSEQGTSYYKIALAAERHLKDYALAVKYWQKIATEVPLDSRSYVARLAAERCRQLAGQGPETGAAAPRARTAGEAAR